MDHMTYDETIAQLDHIQRAFPLNTASYDALQKAIEDLELLRDTINQQKMVPPPAKPTPREVANQLETYLYSYPNTSAGTAMRESITMLYELDRLRGVVKQQRDAHDTATMTASVEAPVDMVNHPPHYNSHPRGIECIDVIESMPYNVACAIKYLWRAGEKGTFDNWLQDLEKAIWYAQRRQGELIEQEANRHPERFGCSTPEQMR